MKKIGLIGGTSPKSTVDYYVKINDFVNASMGNFHSAKILMVSVDFEEIVDAIFSNRWDVVFQIMKEAALTLQNAGADTIALCSNTLHKVYPELRSCLDISILHILDPVIEVIKKEKMDKIAILGTTYTMAGDFYPSYFKKHCSTNINLVIPTDIERKIVNDFIFNSLCKGRWTEKNITDILRIIDRLIKAEQPDSIMLGCTELSYFFEKIGIPYKLIDTTDLHSRALANFICKDFNKPVMELASNLSLEK